MSESQIMALYSSDMLSTHIEYDSADLYDTYTIYNLVDIHWDILNGIMSLYHLHNYWIFGLNASVGMTDLIGQFVWLLPIWQFRKQYIEFTIIQMYLSYKLRYGRTQDMCGVV